jgi:tRNA-dihydrouridine synthase
MVRSGSVARNNGSSLDVIDTHDGDTPTGVQLLAKSVDELRGALDRLEAGAATTRGHFRNIAAVDLNFGCPSPDVIRNGSGPAMLKRRARLTDLFVALVAWKRDCGLDVKAVGCKIRLGLNRTEAEAKVYLPLVDAANEAGLDYLVVHARHAGQRSRDAPAWDAIAEVKARAAMPVIGNGNVFSAADAVSMRRQTGCDGVMLARAAVRNPWVFRDFLPGAAASPDAAWDGGRYWPSVAEVDAAEAAYATDAQRAGTKPKFVAFHQRNFERLRRVAVTGDRSLAVDSPATIHLT